VQLIDWLAGPVIAHETAPEGCTAPATPVTVADIFINCPRIGEDVAVIEINGN
jgi:hypothetical protein